jgi:protein-L-isoaspartate(D-aspartate) O-methyltransferase
VSGEPRKIRFVLALRHAGVTDTKVLAAMERTPREAFVPPQFRDKAYDEIALPIGAGQTLSSPAVVARMTQALDVRDRMKILEVGTGSGYQTAVLARLCRRVYTVERHRRLLAEAERRFKELRLTNITAWIADGNGGWPQQAPFMRILVTAAAPEIPETLLEQLGVGGVMVLPVGPVHGKQILTRVTRTTDSYDSENLGPIRFVPMTAGRIS